MTAIELTDYEPAYARRASRMRASEIRELLKLLDRLGLISFAGGIPDPALFPSDRAAQAYAEALASPVSAASALQYSTSEGYRPLLGWIARHMGKRGVAASEANIIITSGSQQALDFLGRLLLSPGDTALVEAPTYLGALQAFSAYEPRFDTVRPEGSNRSPQSYIDAAAAAQSALKFIYLVPDFANPTGASVSELARGRLLDLAEAIDVPVLEDTAYHALRYDGAQLPSLQAMDVARTGSLDASRVIYLGTFSKTVAPGLRIGWICASRALIRRLVLVKQASDLNAPVLNQMVMHALVGDHHADMIEVARRHYRPKRDAMIAALERFMPEGVTWTRPEGGLFVWLTLPAHINAADLLQRAIDEAGVAFVPGGAFFHDGRGTNILRLSFSLPDPQAITEGIRRLAALI